MVGRQGSLCRTRFSLVMKLPRFCPTTLPDAMALILARMCAHARVRVRRSICIHGDYIFHNLLLL